MNLDLRGLPRFARPAFEREHAPRVAQAASAAPERQEVAPEERRPSSPAAGVPPFARTPRGFAVQPLQALLALAGILLLSMGPTASGRAASARPPASPGVAATSRVAGTVSPGAPPSRRAVPAAEVLAAELDDLDLRAAIVVRRLELADRRLLAVDAAAALDASCPLGIDWVSVSSPNEVKGRCRRGPSVGLAAVPAYATKGAGLETLARSSSPQPGVVVRGDAGPSDGGGR